MKLFAGLTALATVALAGVLPADLFSRDLSTLEQRTPQTVDGACTHGPSTRACWKNGFSIATDFDKKSPRTGQTVSYDLKITNGTCNPDGNGDRICFLINGQYPGPLIRASWGDNVEIKVTNLMQDNGTAMHFHGVRQLNTCGADGVGGITQCPIAPGSSFTYKFVATQFGTSWYHSHFSNQYGDGVVGPMIFDGPATANYDVDLGTYPLSDWYYQTAFQVAWLSQKSLQTRGGPPPASNVLINGTNKNTQGGGKYSYVKMTKGKKYRLRLINTSVDMAIRVSLDNHPLTVITSDYVPINPFSAETLLLNIGQRYDVIINANQTASNYWFRADIAKDCFSSGANNGRAVWSYDGVAVADPTSTAYSFKSGCTEPQAMAPYWRQPVPSGSFRQMAGQLDVNITTGSFIPNGDTIVVWALNNTGINVDWAKPTLSYIFDNDDKYAKSMGVIPTLKEGSWNYWLIQQGAGMPPIPHPIHLHGHDFFVLGQGNGVYDGTAQLNWQTPVRRDTATVYGGGWLAMAFRSDNPGAWLMHCHIGFHISEGLGMQFVEEPSLTKMPVKQEYDGVCDAWKKYEKTMYYQKDDSGL